MLYNIVLVSAIQQSESAISIHMSPHCDFNSVSICTWPCYLLSPAHLYALNTQHQVWRMSRVRVTCSVGK